MSFWDRYLAPGDLRRQHHQTPTPQVPLPDPPPSDEQQGPITQIAPTRIDPAHRRRRQNALLYGGIGFTILSTIVTRRSMARKRISSYPGRFTPSNQHIEPPPDESKINGALEAAEALGLATMNVFSIAMAATGGLMTLFDIADIEDLRQVVSQRAGFNVYGGQADPEADKQIEGWVAETLSLKAGKEGVLGKLQGLGEHLEQG